MTANEPILVTAIKDPSSVTELSASQWTELLQQADDEGLSARLYARLDEADLLDQIPQRAREILLDSAIYAEANAVSLRFELNRIRRAVAEQPVPLIALKGIAYLMADLPPARGRSAADIDVMVPREELVEVRRTLLQAGWHTAVMRDYDVHYYETWMHEIPPLWHPERQMATDIHHTIAPLTSRVAPKVDALWSAAVETEQGSKVLCPADMVLHAAVHLFNEDFRLGFRDLVDLHDLLIHFGKDSGFWPALETRAELHECERVLYHLLHFTTRVLGTPVPQDVLERARRAGPPVPIAQLMDLLGVAALKPRRRDERAWFADFAFWCLYVRSHWLRMPPLLLLRHLSTKAWFRVRDRVPGLP